MSRELVESNREIVGSAAYFEKLIIRISPGHCAVPEVKILPDPWNLWQKTVFVICSSRIWNNLSGNLNEIWSKAFEITITSGTKTRTVSELR